MAGKYDIPDTQAVLIGLPWDFSVKLPLNMAGYHCRFSLRKQANLTLIQSWTDATAAVTIGSFNSNTGLTPVTILLPAADTAQLKSQSATYVVEVATNLSTEAGGERYLEGRVPIRK